MKTAREVLLDAHPLRHEPRRSAESRHSMRQFVVHSRGRAGEIRRTVMRRAVLLASACVVLASVGVLWPRVTADAVAAIRLEVRPAKYHSAAGLREARWLRRGRPFICSDSGCPKWRPHRGAGDSVRLHYPGVW